MEVFSLEQLNNVEANETYLFEVTDRFTVRKILTGGGNEYVWESIRENIKMLAKESVGYYELKKHEP
jgi:hypothetical protein